MFNPFKSRLKPSSVSLPTGVSVYAVGDVHGRIDLLDRLIASIDDDAEERRIHAPTIIFTGDLIDRGPASAAVVARLHDLKAARPETRFLMGNHEEVFLAALEGGSRAMRGFCRIGGRETAISYGIEPECYERMDYDELRDALVAAVPDCHRRFLASFEDMVVLGDYAFVHAGVHPERSLDAQRPEDLRWIRTPFLDHRGTLEKTIVHGHTATDEVEWRPHRIGVDTGAYRTGRLTAVGLQDDRRWLVQT
ncbi:metallophosphoesterase family protein [uncultured Sphingomonas sp.]|uniref:metallophosphoesterase family protein n=1 Tax=uncultured Sphingomonas sp. TaxID=158754 RepID=UPI0035CA6ABB